MPPDRLIVTEDDIQRAEAIAEQWMLTFNKTGKLRHLATALVLLQQAAQMRRALPSDATRLDTD